MIIALCFMSAIIIIAFVNYWDGKMNEILEDMDRQYREICLAFEEFQLSYLELRNKELKRIKKEGDDE